jgi:hypothetical protein
LDSHVKNCINFSIYLKLQEVIVIIKSNCTLRYQTMQTNDGGRIFLHHTIYL